MVQVLVCVILNVLEVKVAVLEGTHDPVIEHQVFVVIVEIRVHATILLAHVAGLWQQVGHAVGIFLVRALYWTAIR